MIHSVSFRNFKALRRVDLSLERLTVIVGENASGKTSILQGLHYLSRLATISPNEFLETSPHPWDLYSREGSGDLEVTAQLTEGRASFKITFSGPLPADLLQAAREPGAVPRYELDASGQENGADQPPRRLWHLPTVCQALRGAALVWLDPAKCAGPSYSPEASRDISPDGTGLPSVLASLALTYPDEFEELQNLVRQVIPTVRRIRLIRVPMYRGAGGEWLELRGSAGTGTKDHLLPFDNLVFDMQGASSLPGQLVSEGTLLVVGLLTVLLRPPRPHLVLVDDLGHGLHPMAQQKLVGLLRALMERHPDLQIVATTHSPYLLDSLRPEEVRLTTLNEDGSTACAALTEHPDFERWKEEMAPGEFWSLIGEKWVGNRNGVGSPA